ncbi:long-chain fatty acid--CoA ligase [Nocardiaceae bacterium YC2-7]|uniref:Long-chain fatty acid--CoA ligase n=1 Tax=Antrihabitans stalactiti TaxID=2584121 RepID=A0A848KTM8_9NOCA|nr:long-chain fatty acid--CoA ligase [Antrihabitans stalactiti]
MLAHPAVLDAATTSGPDKNRGESVKALARSSWTPQTAPRSDMVVDILAHTRARLAAYEVPPVDPVAMTHAARRRFSKSICENHIGMPGRPRGVCDPLSRGRVTHSVELRGGSVIEFFVLIAAIPAFAGLGVLTIVILFWFEIRRIDPAPGAVRPVRKTRSAGEHGTDDQGTCRHHGRWFDEYGRQSESRALIGRSCRHCSAG